MRISDMLLRQLVRYGWWRWRRRVVRCFDSSFSTFFFGVCFVSWDDTSWGWDLCGGVELLLSKGRQLINLYISRVHTTLIIREYHLSFHDSFVQLLPMRIRRTLSSSLDHVVTIQYVQIVAHSDCASRPTTISLYKALDISRGCNNLQGLYRRQFIL